MNPPNGPAQATGSVDTEKRQNVLRGRHRQKPRPNGSGRRDVIRKNEPAAGAGRDSPVEVMIVVDMVNGGERRRGRRKFYRQAGERWRRW